MSEGGYSPEYFSSPLFSQDYDAVAEAIIRTYAPGRVLDAGCGPGSLSRALASRGVSVLALDGHARPEFGALPVQFQPCDFDSPAALELVRGRHGGSFDLTVSLEVAEHLQPGSSDHFADFLCAMAPTLVFSAAVPGQGGHGHINCQPRTEWHDRFVRRGFSLAHRLRPGLVGNPGLAPWYRFNLLDYTRGPAASAEALSRSLLQAESEMASALYRQGEQLIGMRNQLDQSPVRAYFRMRAALKRLLRGR